jgi:phospholipid/cholesterol/gamma-HCH transport system substrate-binding protein
VISRRLLINLFAFFLFSAVLVAYGWANLLGSPLANPTILTTSFPSASGLYPNFTVELNGVPVGSVKDTTLTQHATKVTMTINPGTAIPDDVQASVQIANDLGEQVIDLVPTRAGNAPALRSGDYVPPDKNQVPADVGAVVASFTRLVAAIPPHQLNQLISELATALAGRAGDLRTIIQAGNIFNKEFVAYQQQFTELLANAPPALDAVTAVSPELKADLANTAALVQVLAQQKTNLKTLLGQGANAFGQVNNLITTQAANLGCFLHDTAGIVSNIASPTNLANLSTGLSFNQYFFGAVDKIAVPGLAKPTTNGGKANPNQEFLRTRLIIPPELTQGSSYATANPIPDILPGAGCVTAYGNGVGPATQAGFSPAAGGHLVAPTAAEANVELPATSGPSASAALRQPAQSQWALVGVGGLLLPVLLLAWGARPSRRRARRRA